MPRKLETLNQTLDVAQHALERGDSAAAANLIDLVKAECLLIIADKITDMTKYLEALVTHDTQATNLEFLAKSKKPKT